MPLGKSRPSRRSSLGLWYHCSTSVSDLRHRPAGARRALAARRFPPPWSVDDPDVKLGQACFIVRDGTFLAGHHGETMHPAGRNLVGILVLIFGFLVGVVIQEGWYWIAQKISEAIFG
jgi:hypothetical protein